MIPSEVFDVLDSLQMLIVKGENPPDVTGSYIVNPNILMRSTNGDDVVGSKYTDYFVAFRSPGNGNSSFITLKEIVAEDKSGKGAVSYITGNGNGFTVFTKMETTDEINNETYLSVEIYTGTKTDDGIENFYNASVMIDNHGNINGEGSMFRDGDNIALKIGL